MTRRTPAAVLLAAAAALALAACAHSAGTGSATTHRSPATVGLGANPEDSPTDTAAPPTSAPTTSRPAPTPSKSTTTNTGPRIVSFAATGAVCPAHGPGYDQPGQVTVSWKLANADGVSLAIDGGLWKSYDGAQGSDTLPFQCPNPGKTNTHKYTLTVKNTNVWKTVSASAPAEPA